jgi:hypothetical protein
MDASGDKSMKRLILVPAVMTLGVTVLRLVGELQDWSPRLFSRAAGGGGAIVGIGWLVPIFGVYFALELVKAGQGPSRPGRAIGFAFLGFLVACLGFIAVALGIDFRIQLLITVVFGMIFGGIAVALRGKRVPATA